jgi:hypothetical protein
MILGPIDQNFFQLRFDRRALIALPPHGERRPLTRTLLSKNLAFESFEVTFELRFEPEI